MKKNKSQTIVYVIEAQRYANFVSQLKSICSALWTLFNWEASYMAKPTINPLQLKSVHSALRMLFNWEAKFVYDASQLKSVHSALWTLFN